MYKRLIIMCLTLVTFATACGMVLAQDPVKWSAPADQYPQQWNPTPAPPVYNPYGYPYYPYGEGAYGYYGHGQNQAYSYGYGMPNQNYGAGYYSGNPYYGR